MTTVGILWGYSGVKIGWLFVTVELPSASLSMFFFQNVFYCFYWRQSRVAQEYTCEIFLALPNLISMFLTFNLRHQTSRCYGPKCRHDKVKSETFLFLNVNLPQKDDLRVPFASVDIRTTTKKTEANPLRNVTRGYAAQSDIWANSSNINVPPPFDAKPTASPDLRPALKI